MESTEIIGGLSERTVLRTGGSIGVKSQHASLIIIMYIYHALINALNARMIHINLNYKIFYTHVEHSPTKQFI